MKTFASGCEDTLRETVLTHNKESEISGAKSAYYEAEMNGTGHIVSPPDSLGTLEEKSLHTSTS